MAISDGGNEIGKRVNGEDYAVHDAILINITSSNYTPTSEIDDETAQINGVVTKDAIAYFASNDTTIHRRGQVTGSETHSVHSHDHYDQASGIEDLVIYNGPYGKSGDSGGIYYYKSDSSSAYISSIHSGDLNPDDDDADIDYPAGAAGYALTNHGLSFS